MKNRKKIHNDWETPEWLLKEIEDEFGKFFDPCPLNPDFDGLEIDWKKVNYVNPPYNQKGKEAFIWKSWKERCKGNTVVMLLPVSTSTKIFHSVIYHYAEIRFLKGRVKFKGINSKGEYVENKCGQHDSMLIIFKPR